MRRIYMDANATTPLLPEVFDAMRPFLLEQFGNASSIHQQGQHARAAVDHARESVARLLKCRASEIIFTSGGTESDNLALFGTLQPGDHLITSAIEHHAVLHSAEALEKRGVEVTFLPCDASGVISVESLQQALRPNTRLVSIMLANNETGTIQSIPELAALAKEHGALFHTDAVQAAGKLPLDLSQSCSRGSGSLKDVDMLSISGHKMYAPQGTGILYARRHVRLAPLFHGGTHERQRRAGTENVAGIVALGRAAELAQQWLDNPGVPSSPNHEATGTPPLAPEMWELNSSTGPVEVSSNHLGAPFIAPLSHAMSGSASSSGGLNSSELAQLRDRLEQTLLTLIPESGVNGAGPNGNPARTPNTSNLFFDHVEAEALVIALDLKGLSVSGGSACQSGATEPSHVLTAMGLSPARARASIRLSLSRLNTAEEVAAAVKIIPEAVARLRSLSPTWKHSHALAWA